MACALLVGCLNFYLGAFRRPLYRWRHGTMEGCPNVSGIPLIGTLFVVIGGIVGFGDWRAAVLGLVVLALDLTGLPWLAICLWSEPSLLDSE